MKYIYTFIHIQTSVFVCICANIYIHMLQSIQKKEAENPIVPFLTVTASKGISQMLNLTGIKQQ